MDKTRTIYAVMAARKTMEFLGNPLELPKGHYFIAAYDDYELARHEAINADCDVIPMVFNNKIDVNKEWMEE